MAIDFFLSLWVSQDDLWIKNQRRWNGEKNVKATLEKAYKKYKDFDNNWIESAINDIVEDLNINLEEVKENGII